MPKVSHHPQIFLRSSKNGFSVRKTGEGCEDGEWLMAPSQLMESKCELHFGCWYFLTPRHSHMVTTWGTKTTVLSGGERRSVCVLQLLWKRACISGSVAIGGCGLLWCLAKLTSLKSPKVIYLFNRRLIFFHLHGKCLTPKAALKAKHSR
jgi:hypothetical protein